MTTETQFLSFIKVRGINYKIYDYIEGRTSENFMKNHPTVIEFRRYYQNPFFWKILLDDKKFKLGLDYFFEEYGKYADKVIINSIIPSINKDNKHYIYPLIKNQLQNTEDKEIDADSYLMSTIIEEKPELFDDILNIILELDIKPLFGSFGNIANCQGLLELAKNGNKNFIIKLINFGINPSLDDSMSYIMALKHGFYEIGLLLKNAGANIFTRNNLGLKMIQRNDEKQLHLSEENQKARTELMELYEKNI